MTTRRSYTRQYVAFVGKRIVGTGKTPVAAVRKAVSAGADRAVLQTAFASRALVERVEATGRAVRFVMNRNGRAGLPA